MGNVIKNDMAALRSLNQLNKNSQLLGKSLQKVASGMKINSAADSASAYSISEKMRIQIRALNQCSDNTKTGSDMLKIAEGAVDNQIDLIKRMKEIALDAANDTNTDVDRATMQKEVNARMMELNDISYSTNYNGRQLLNGAVPGTQITQFNAAGKITQNTTPVVPETDNTTSHSPYSLKCYLPSDEFLSLNRTPDPVYEFTVDPAPAGKLYQAGDIVYDANRKPYTVVLDPTTNAPSILDGNGVYQAIGNGFNAYEGVYTPVNLANTVVGKEYSIVDNTNAPSQYPQLYTMGTLPDGTNALKQMPANTPNIDSNLIGSANSNFYDFNFPSANLPTALDQQGFSVLCDACDQFVCVKFDASQPANSGQYYKDPNSSSECYIIGIAGLTNVNDIYDALEQGMAQVNGGTVGNSEQTLTPYHNVKLHFYTDGNNDKHCYVTKDDGRALDIYNGVVGQVETIGGRRPYQNLTIQGDTVSSQYTNISLPNTTLNALFPSQNSDWDIEPTDADYPDPWPAGYEEDRTWPPEWGEDYIKTSTLDAKRKRLFREETWPYPVKGALSSGSCVSTREKATKFISSLDQALKYLTNAATTLGVQRTRLEAMNDNIVTSHENTTAAESVIRDADMAKEMTNYTKYNVLAQSAQSMLSQANQNTSGSLNLLQ